MAATHEPQEGHTMHEGQEPSFTMPDGLAELQAALETTWPAFSTALRASGVPLNEETPEEKAAREKKEKETADAAAAAAAAKKKPWGDDADFDPEKAWKLIENLRADVTKYKTAADTANAKVKEFEDADKSATDLAAERATTAEKAAADAKRETSRLRIAVKKGLTETQAKRLVGDTDEELEADADELLTSFKPDDTSGGDKLRRRPTEKLRPGAAPDADPDETDPEKLAAQVPRM